MHLIYKLHLIGKIRSNVRFNRFRLSCYVIQCYSPCGCDEVTWKIVKHNKTFYFLLFFCSYWVFFTFLLSLSSVGDYRVLSIVLTLCMVFLMEIFLVLFMVMEIFLCLCDPAILPLKSKHTFRCGTAKQTQRTSLKIRILIYEQYNALWQLFFMCMKVCVLYQVGTWCQALFLRLSNLHQLPLK